jgi:hypothetical protein
MNSSRSLFRNKVTEQEIREYLHANGFEGPSARFDYVELKAIQRPGWVQVFQFSVCVTDEDDIVHHLLGVARDDERRGIEIFLTESESERDNAMEAWSAGLITLGRQKPSFMPVLLAIFASVLLLAVLSAVLSR